MMINKRAFALALLGLGLAARAHEGQTHRAPGALPREQKPWGIAGEPRRVQRTIRITMSDAMRFTPDDVTVKLGEVVRFVLLNQGQMLHEFVVGNRAELEAHAALMVRFPGMKHDEPYMAHVDKGRQQELVWQFNRPGEFEFACLIPGHFQAGMIGRIHVLTK